MWQLKLREALGEEFIWIIPENRNYRKFLYILCCLGVLGATSMSLKYAQFSDIVINLNQPYYYTSSHRMIRLCFALPAIWLLTELNYAKRVRLLQQFACRAARVRSNRGGPS